MLNRENTIRDLKNKNYSVELGSFANVMEFQELPFVKKLNLQGDSNNKDFMVKVEKILESVLPTEPNTCTKNGKIKIMWLGPNEWLIVEDDQKEKNDLLIKLKNEIGDKKAAITDVSENRTILKIIARSSTEEFLEKNILFTLLAKFIPLDLDKNLTNSSSVVQTLFVKVPIIIVRNYEYGQYPEVDIFANRSHSNYIYNLLVDGTNKNLVPNKLLMEE